MISDANEAEPVLLTLQLPSLTQGPGVKVKLERCSYRTGPSQRSEFMYPLDGAVQSDMWLNSAVSAKVSKEGNVGQTREMEMEMTDAPCSSKIELLTAMRLWCALWMSRIMVTVGQSAAVSFAYSAL